MNLLSQILAVVIFVVMFVEIVRERRPRYIVTRCAGALSLFVVFLGLMHACAAVEEALSFGSMASTTVWYTGHAAVNEMNTGINWSTIIFISGMMIMVEGMRGAGFFDWLCLRLARLVLDGREEVPGEIQLRTVAMDFWASLEHQLRYKNEKYHSSIVDLELKACAEINATLDKRMQGLFDELNNME